MLTFATALVLLAGASPIDAAAGFGQEPAAREATASDGEAASARAFVDALVADLNTGEEVVARFDAAWLSQRALASLPAATRERVETAVSVERREEALASVGAEWAHSGAFADLGVVGGHRASETFVFGLHDVDFDEPWSLWVARRPDGAWALGEAVHVPSGWSLAWAAAARFVGELERTEDAEPVDAFAVLRESAARALRDEQHGALDGILTALDALELGDAERAAADELSALTVTASDDWPSVLVQSRAAKDGATLARAAGLRLVAEGRPTQAKDRLQRARFAHRYDAHVLAALARCEAAAGRGDAAEALAREAWAHSRGSVDVLLVLDEVLGAKGTEELLAFFGSTEEPERYFEALVDAWIGRRDAEAVQALLAARRAQDAADPWVPFAEAGWHRVEGRHADAAAVLSGAFPLAEAEGVLPDFHGAFVHAMDALGKGLEAYRSVGRTTGAFEGLASALAARSVPEEIIALCDEHEREWGPTPWSDLWRAWALLEAGRHEEAVVAAGRARDFDGFDEHERDTCQQIFVEGLLRAGRWREAYEELGASTFAFEVLAGSLWEAQRGDDLLALVEHHRSRSSDPVSDELAMWTCEALFVGGQTKAALAAFETHRDEIVKDDDVESLEYWEDRVVRLLVRDGQVEQALVLALAIDTRSHDPIYVAMTQLAGDRPTIARGALERCLGGGRTPLALLTDPDVGRGLLRDDAAELREWLQQRALRGD